MARGRAEQTRFRVESLEDRQLMATFVSWLIAPWTAEVSRTAGPSVGEIPVSRPVDDATTNLF